MTDVNAEIEEVRAMGGKTKAAKAAADSARERKERALCKRIASGKGTTGDRVRDFVIATYGISPDGNVLQNYLELDKAVRAHPGEFVLMVTKWKESRFHGGPDHVPQPHDFGVRETLYLGVLGKRPLLLHRNKGICALPTTRHVRCRSVHHESMELVREPMTPERMRDFGLSLNKRLVCHEPGTHYELEVKVGDVEVLAWFESQRSWPLAGNSLHLWAFRNMAKLLKRPTPPSKALDTLLVQKQSAISEVIIGLVARRNAVLQQIAEITRTHQSEHDRESKLWQPNRELRELKAHLKKMLASALTLGMEEAALLSIPSLCKEYHIKQPSS